MCALVVGEVYTLELVLGDKRDVLMTFELKDDHDPLTPMLREAGWCIRPATDDEIIAMMVGEMAK